MGKPVKISDRKKEWFLRGQKARRADALAERERILIVCQGGKTEPNYFDSIKKELPPQIVEMVIQDEALDPLKLVGKAKALYDERANGDYPFDQVWAVFDCDDFLPHNIDNAIKKAETDKIKCAWSNEAFELWYVLHFEYRNTAMPRTEYQDKLTDLMGRKYEKNATDMYQRLSESGSQAQASGWARRLHEDVVAAHTPPSRANPCTTVYALVETLNAFRPPPEPAAPEP